MRHFISPRRLILAAISLQTFISGVSRSASACAAGPKVAFDLAYAVECREVGGEEFARLHANEKLMEADLRVSVRIDEGDEQELEQLTFEIISADKRLRIVDFLPHTQVQSGSGEVVEVVKTTENIQSLSTGMATSFSLERGAGARANVNLQPLPAGNASVTHRKATTETTKRLPPGRVVVASGTIDNEHGVFFKMRASATTSFEGVKPFSFRFAVPNEWRGDWVLFSALAECQVKRHLFSKSNKERGRAKVFVALYSQGDADAQRAASELARMQEVYFSCEHDTGRRGETITELAGTALARPIAFKHGPSRAPPFKIDGLRFPSFEPRGGPRADEADDPRVALRHALGELAGCSEVSGRQRVSGLLPSD